MADFKFSCPHCQQHIQCDTGYSGMQINCPACQKPIVVPPAPGAAAAPRAAAPPPPPAAPPRSGLVPPPPPPSAPPGLATKQSTAAPSAGKRFGGAPTLPGTQAAPPPKKSGALKAVASVVAALVGAAIGFFGVQYLMGNLGHGKAPKANPAAQVAAPTANAAIQALSILTKVHAAYTNSTSAKADGTFSMYLVLSNLTMEDVNPNAPANAQNANRRPLGMPRVVTNITELTLKRAQSNWFYVAGEAVTRADRQPSTNTFAFWSSDKGRFMFSDTHMRGIPASYQQLPDVDPKNDPTEQLKQMQRLFDDPANLNKIVKDLGQTEDESVSGHDCYTLTAKILGQKVKIWVDKTSYLIWQWQITLGGQITDADIDDAFSLAAAGFTNMPPGQFDMMKMQTKKMTPAVAKIRGVITFTAENIEENPTLSADDFDYAVPPGVRLIRPRNLANGTASSLQARQRNTCINNLREIDAAKYQWSLEKGKKDGDDCTEADIKPYLKGGTLPKCPAGGKYTIGKIGEKPTCSVSGHELP